MKFDTQLANFLYQYKTLPLQGIGDFNLYENVVNVNTENNDNVSNNSNTITFTPNKKTVFSNELKEFLKLQNTKPISLITSDLEDYVIEIESWLNIGKSYTIEGIGTLTKKQNSIITFVEGKERVENIASLAQAVKKTEVDEKQIAYKKSSKKRNIILAIGSTLLLSTLAIIAWVLLGKNGSFFENNKKQPVKIDTPKINSIQVDTTKRDTLLVLAPVNDTVKYKMYFLTTKSKANADKVFASWIKYDKINRDSALINDTLRYRLFIYKRILPKDTIATKQKLKAYFAHDITIEPSN